MILKIIAMGFFMRAHSYLRDAWNIVSFVNFYHQYHNSFSIAGFYRGHPRLGKRANQSSKRFRH